MTIRNNRSIVRIGSLLVLMSFMLAISNSAAQAQTFKFRPLGFVTPNAINGPGTGIAGYYCCSYSAGFDGPEADFHGFSLTSKTLFVPNGVSNVFKVVEPAGSQDSFSTGISAIGNVVGGFCPAPNSCSTNNAVHGFLFYSGSNSTAQIDVPGANATLVGGIQSVGGQMVGMYCQTTTCGLASPSEAHGFLLKQVGGNFVTLDFPGKAVVGTSATGINDSEEIVGNYLACTSQTLSPCAFAQTHGFQLIGGVYTTIDPPGSIGTSVSGVNSSGEIVGTYADGSHVTHGFVLIGGTFSIVDFPGATATIINGVDDHGNIVGYAQGPGSIENFLGTLQ